MGEGRIVLIPCIICTKLMCQVSRVFREIQEGNTPVWSVRVGSTLFYHVIHATCISARFFYLPIRGTPSFANIPFTMIFSFTMVLLQWSAIYRIANLLQVNWGEIFVVETFLLDIEKTLWCNWNGDLIVFAYVNSSNQLTLKIK